MKNLLLLFLLFLGVSTGAFSQDVVLQRTSDLMPQRYVINGDAFLEELSDGSLTLTLSDDFSTPRGPDVRILLGNSLSLTGAVEIVNLTRINHFSGERTFAVPAGVGINDFDNILFFCVAFQQFWASGTFGDAIDPNGGGGFVCAENEVMLSNGGNDVNICATDNMSDELRFANSISAQTSNYTYLITNENNILTAVVNDDFYDFEGASSETQRVHGIHFDGTLNPVIGANRMETTASGCFIHSNENGFITVRKTADCVSNFDCQDNLTATTDWMTSAEICPGDGNPDWVELRNSLFIAPGDHYAYVITDERQTVQQIVTDSNFNFENSGLATQRVYGIHYDGMLNPVIGAHRMQTTATGCFTHSGDDLFLTITKTACEPAFECVETLTATTNWATELDLCTNDAIPDAIPLLNNRFEKAGENYVYLFTDEFEILKEVVFDTIYNFEGTGDEIIRVYGMSYDGDLSPQIGQHRKNTTASNCFTHSGDDLFLTINKTAACNSTSSTQNAFLQSQIEVFPNPNNGQVFIKYGEATDIDRIEIFNNTGELLKTTDNQASVEIDHSGIFLLRFVSNNQAVTKRVMVQR